MREEPGDEGTREVTVDRLVARRREYRKQGLEYRKQREVRGHELSCHCVEGGWKERKAGGGRCQGDSAE